ncbi:MAG: 5-dehydro-4-deoxy-D-glucuronate isomerase, partial [Opitutaceae bacterium]|nr:5-dehydro-4-deoxy-D-glucuronate isomerase [Opitutaceae bacterium]
MRHILAQHPAIVPAMPPAELRRNFLLTDLFVPGKINRTWWETDRTILGGICPAATPLVLL